MRITSPGREASHFDDLLLPVEAHAVGGHRVGEAARDFRVEKRHQRVAAVDQMHLDAQRGERAGVLAADHAAADHDELLRHRLELEDLVRVVHAVVLEGKLRRPQRRRTRGDEDLLAADQRLRAASPAIRIVCGSTKLAVPWNLVTPRSASRASTPLPFAVRHLFLVPHEVGDRGLAPEREVDAEEPARAPAREHERGLAQRLAGDGAGVDAGAADARRLLDEGDFPAEEARGDGAARAGGAAAEDDEIESSGGSWREITG